MKTRILSIISILLLNCSIASNKEVLAVRSPSQDGTINVLTTQETYSLTVKWASEYCRLNPGIKINVNKAQENDLENKLNSGGGIAVITNKSYMDVHPASTWSMVVGRDVIVPIINVRNPFLEEICRKGITREALARIFQQPEKLNWGMLLENGQTVPMHFYLSDDVSLKSGLASFLHTDQNIINVVTSASGQETARAVQNDATALGFCKLVNIMDFKNQRFTENIKLLPIDKNGNGKIDFIENIYDNPGEFSRGVWIGKYPKALSGNIYTVSSAKPVNQTEVAFLKWVLADGQGYLYADGFCDLVSSERQTQMEKLTDTGINIATSKNDSYAILKVISLILITLVMIGLIADYILRRKKTARSQAPDTVSAFPLVFDEESVTAPKGLYFDKTHTWAFMEQDGTVKIGIDDFLQHITGTLTRIEMRNAGEKVKKGERLLTIIRKGKQLNIYSPISGTIKAHNGILESNSSSLNASPYSDGWVYKVEPTNWALEIQFLSMADKYKIWLKDEFGRLKDFIATTVTTNTPEYAKIVLQDGGRLMDSILADLGPEVWDDFQTKFIDTAK